jgi:hypothetical protein
MVNRTETVKVYLGGSHLDTTGWRHEFQLVARELARHTGVQMHGIDPFDREIDENDNHAIIRHDLALLRDDRLQFVVLKSLDHKGNLSTGTACEMMLAHSMDKPVIVLVDRPPQGEQPWLHPFIEHFASHITDNVSDVVSWIVDHMPGNPGEYGN